MIWGEILFSRIAGAEEEDQPAEVSSGDGGVRGIPEDDAGRHGAAVQGFPGDDGNLPGQTECAGVMAYHGGGVHGFAAATIYRDVNADG